MKPAVAKGQALKIAETVLAALGNKANQYKEFAFEHFDAARKGTRTVRFRLVTYEPDIEDVYRDVALAAGQLADRSVEALTRHLPSTDPMRSFLVCEVVFRALRDKAMLAAMHPDAQVVVS